MSALRWAESIILQLPLRLGLGGLFVFAAFNKLQNIQAFTFAIKGFKIVDPQTHGHLIVTAAYTIPWVEMLAGAMLILGLRTRASALTLGLTLVAFIAGLMHVIMKDIHADCSCFGDTNLICDESVGWCQVIRNLVLLVPAVYLTIRGGGILAVDALFERRARARDADATYPQQRVDESSVRA